MRGGRAVRRALNKGGALAYNVSMQKTTARISLSAIRRNAAHLKDRAFGRTFFAVVKADAYGHGAIEVARALSNIAEGFCVAIVDEGVELRAAGISAPVLVLTPPMDADDALRMRAYDLMPTVVDKRTAHMCRSMPVHIKINTGMNRYGCPPQGLNSLLSECAGCRICGVYSHIYAPLSKKDVSAQVAAFRECAGMVKAVAPSACAHLAATAGTLAGGELLFEGVRCGIGLYGYAPEGFADGALVPAMKVYARRVQSFSPPVGGGVGYAVSKRKYNVLSSYRAGYADGLARTYALGEGYLCMDSFVAESGADEVCVFSDAKKYAEKLGTISYEALCAVTKRSRRVYEE